MSLYRQKLLGEAYYIFYEPSFYPGARFDQSLEGRRSPEGRMHLRQTVFYSAHGQGGHIGCDGDKGKMKGAIKTIGSIYP